MAWEATHTYIVVALSATLLVAIVSGICCCCCFRKKKKKKDEEEGEEYDLENKKTGKQKGKGKQFNDYSNITVPHRKSTTSPIKPNINTGFTQSPNTSLVETAMQTAMTRIANAIIIDSSRLTLGEAVANGHFGIVYKAELRSKDGRSWETVAVKTVGTDTGVEDMTQFLEEAMRMRSFCHEHVLTMLGLVTEGDKPLVVLPWMDKGDLKTFLMDENETFTIKNMLELCVQVADGMTYLSSRNFIHRDLAARNCMVNSDGVVKVADFGLSHDLFDDDYYRSESDKPLPIKWLAVECITEKKYSEKSDVWSFGILMWEVLTRGEQPYPDMKKEQVKEHVQKGGRLIKPAHVPAEIYSLMTDCWQHTPADRPSFRDVTHRLRLILQEGGTHVKKKGKKVALNKDNNSSPTKQYYN